MTRKKLRFLPSEMTVEFTDEESVLEVALKNGLEIPHSCGAMGSCSTCRVIVREAKNPLPERTELEQDIADMRGFDESERLSCQLPPADGLVLLVPTDSFT